MAVRARFWLAGLRIPCPRCSPQAWRSVSVTQERGFIDEREEAGHFGGVRSPGMQAGLHGEPEFDQLGVLGAVMGRSEAGRSHHHELVHRRRGYHDMWGYRAFDLQGDASENETGTLVAMPHLAARLGTASGSVLGRLASTNYMQGLTLEK